MQSFDDLFVAAEPTIQLATIPKKDKRILISLARQISSGVFLTENQAKLLIKILKENEEHITIAPLDSVVWSKPFRKLEQVKKITIDGPDIIVEFTYNKRIKSVVLGLQKIVDGILNGLTASKFSLPLTERNILLLLKLLEKENFEIQAELLQYYSDMQDLLSQRDTYFTFDTLAKSIQEPLTSNLLLVDRRYRYQYSIANQLPKTTLAEKIASRNTTKVYVNAETVTLTELLRSLIALERLPVLFVFNQHDATESLHVITELKKSITDLELEPSVGIYFRFESGAADSDKMKFNSFIKENLFNAHLTTNTKFVGVANTQLPKFLLREEWYPSTVVSFTNNFKNNKTSVYCDAVDLTVYFNRAAPVIKELDEIV